ncbi:MAG: thymidine kinase [Blastocatellia bacterium AA13]|nr:MAG: thymidine kinase [Blastocatellia bacterium AA13]
MDGLSPRGGWIEVITGGMFSGKSEELIRRIRRAEIARQRTQIFKPAIDNRFDAKRIISRDNRGVDAIVARDSVDLRSRLEFGVRVVGVDEVQFFDQNIVDVCMELADAGVRVIVAGLDQDYLRRPFGPMPALLAVAEYVSKMHAICVRCGSPAHYTQRTAGGDSQIEVGDGSYEARCRMCYEPYRAPSDSTMDKIKTA